MSIQIISRGAGGREKLTADRTYYVRTDGSDSNTGLVDSAGGAFLTIQKAIDVAATLDFGGYTVTVQVKDGTYTGSNTIKVMTGQAGTGSFIIRGNNGTPANVIISTTSNPCFDFPVGTRGQVLDLEMRTTTSGYELSVRGGTVEYGNVRFGTCAQSHIFIGSGRAEAISDYTVSGSAQSHVWARDGGLFMGEFRTVTYSGTPAWSGTGYYATMNGVIEAAAMTHTGAATGKRYEALTGGRIQTGGGGINYFPGNSAGNVVDGTYT